MSAEVLTLAHPRAPTPSSIDPDAALHALVDVIVAKRAVLERRSDGPPQKVRALRAG